MEEEEEEEEEKKGEGGRGGTVVEKKIRYIYKQTRINSTITLLNLNLI
jgi:hypothetical protein